MLVLGSPLGDARHSDPGTCTHTNRIELVISHSNQTCALINLPVLFAVYGLEVFDECGDFGVHGTADEASMSLVMKMGVKVSGESIAKATSSAQSTRVGPVSGLKIGRAHV